MHKLRSFLTLLFVMFFGGPGILHLQAQTIPKFDVRNLVATSPEAAMLGRFGEIPISYYTGTADVSIPLYTIKEGGLEVPVVLRYHGSGIKVEDQATNVGLGWSLEPGGAIIQVVNGEQDDLDNLVSTDTYNFLKTTDPGWPSITTPLYQNPRYTNRYPIGNGLFSAECWLIDPPHQDSYNTLNALEHGQGQPDIYQYNFPGGHSGKFYKNPETGNIVFLDKKEDIVFSKETSGGYGWIAKTMDGNTFYFESIETAIPAGDLSGTTLSRTFKLSKIVVSNGKEINFTYQDAYYTWYGYNETFHTAYPLNMGNGYDNAIFPSSPGATHHVKTLASITGDNTTIGFNLGSRLDLPVNAGSDPNVQKVNSVDIKNAATGSVVKSFVFTYDYFISPWAGHSYLNRPYSPLYTPTSAETKRLKLLSVQEVGYTGSGQVTKPPYTFDYEESFPLPLKTSFARDFWGYYNGQENDKLLPDLRFFYYSDDNTYKQNIPTGLLSSYVGANRAPDSTKMKAGILRKITYPTGGWTVFDYQAHNFGNHAYPDMQKLQNTIKNVFVMDTNEPNDNKSQSFTLPANQQVTMNLSFVRGANQNTTIYDMLHSLITLTKTVGGVTTIVKQWELLLGGDYQNQWDQNAGTVIVPGADATVEIGGETGAVYTISVELPDALGEQGMASNNSYVSANFNYYDAPVDYLNSYGGGLRISAISNYTADGAIAGKKVIKYLNTDNTPSGILMTPLRPLYYEMMYSIENSGDYDVLYQQLLVWNVSSESAIPFSDGAQGGIVGYSRVEEVEVAPDGGTKGRHVFTYNNKESDCSTHVPDDPWPLNGMINTDEIYSNSSTVPLQKVTYDYASLEETVVMGYKTNNTFLGALDVRCGAVWINDAGGYDGSITCRHNFKIYFYPIKGHWYLPITKVTEKTENGVTMSTTESYSYNTKGQLVRTDTYDSKQKKKSVIDIYPSDNPGDPMSAQLISLNQYDQLQQQRILLDDKPEQSISGTELAKTYIYYRMENGQAVKDYVTRSYKGAAVYSEVTFDKYFGYKALCQFTENAAPVCLLWSFNYSKPIAEVKNATYTTISSVLGATNIDNFAANANPSDADINTFLAPLRSAAAMSNAQIISYTYKPLAGLSTTTDAKGLTTYYEYDGLLRLLRVRDADNNIIKQYEYQYQAQPGNFTPNWQVTGNYRCVAGTGGYNNGRREQEQKDINPGSTGYNNTRWIDEGVNLSACPLNADWQATGNYRCQTGTGGYATGHQEQEQKDHNPYSSTYNATRWVDLGVNTGACPVVANWQATGNYRCQTGAGGYASGHQEQEQRDLNPYSGTYNTTRWADLGVNTGVCPVVANWQATGNYRCVKNGSNQNTGAQEREERDNNPYSGTYNTVRWVGNGNNYTSCPLPYVFARLTYDLNNGYYANIVVRFYADAACTIPKSVNNLTINVGHTWQNYWCGIVNSETNSYVCNGNTATLINAAALHEDVWSNVTNDYCTIDHNWFLDSGSGYEIVY